MYGQREKRKTAKAMQIHQNKNFHFQFVFSSFAARFIHFVLDVHFKYAFIHHFFSIRYLFPWKLRPCKAIAVDRSNNFLQHERKMLARDNTSFLRFAENLRILWDTNLIPKIEFQRMASMKHYTKFISLWFSHKCSSGLEFFYWIFLTCTKEEKKKLNRRRRMEYHNVEFTQHTSTAPLAM